MIDREKLEKALAEATPGPWGIVGLGSDGFVSGIKPDVLLGCGCCGSPNLTEKNANFIAMAPDLAADWLRLSDRVAELEKERDALAERDKRIRAEERERCAKLALAVEPPDVDWKKVWTAFEHGVDEAQKAIAAAIRKGDE